MIEALISEAGNLFLREKDDYQQLDVVEGTDLCPQCQKYMQLGEAKLCLSVENDELEIVEIVGWAPGGCTAFTKAVSPFETESY